MPARHARDDEPTPQELPAPGRAPLYLVPPGAVAEAAAVLAAVDDLRTALAGWITAADPAPRPAAHHGNGGGRHHYSPDDG